MKNNYKHKDKLEQNKGILMQISIIASLLIVLLLFESKTRSAESYPNSYIEIDLIIEHNSDNKNIKPPNPNANNNSAVNNSLNKTAAEYPGGEAALKVYFTKEIQYPAAAKKKDIQGRVIVSFTIDSSGKIKDAKIIRNIHPLIDTEALRLVKNMPDWKPAMIEGKAINSKQTIPVIFIYNQDYES